MITTLVTFLPVLLSILGLVAMTLIWLLWWVFFGKERRAKRLISEYPPMTPEQEEFITEKIDEEDLKEDEPLTEEEKNFIKQYEEEMNSRN